jgi:hypothetical protein
MADICWRSFSFSSTACTAVLLGCPQLPQRSSTLSLLSLSHTHKHICSLSSGAACAAKPAPRRGDGAGGDGAEPRRWHVAPLPARVLGPRAARTGGAGAPLQPGRCRPHAHARRGCGGCATGQPGASPTPFTPSLGHHDPQRDCVAQLGDGCVGERERERERESEVREGGGVPTLRFQTKPERFPDCPLS